MLSSQLMINKSALNELINKSIPNVLVLLFVFELILP